MFQLFLVPFFVIPCGSLLLLPDEWPSLTNLSLSLGRLVQLGRSLPVDGHLISLESNPKHAEVARNNILRAGLSEIVEIRLGQALDTLPEIAAQGLVFDLIFIDADKPSNPDYFTCALKLSRHGTLIIADNVVRNGAVIDEGSDNPSVQGIRRFNELLAIEPRVSVTEIQTVGSKGYDGFAIAVVTGDV